MNNFIWVMRLVHIIFWGLFCTVFVEEIKRNKNQILFDLQLKNWGEWQSRKVQSIITFFYLTKMIIQLLSIKNVILIFSQQSWSISCWWRKNRIRYFAEEYTSAGSHATPTRVCLPPLLHPMMRWSQFEDIQLFQHHLSEVRSFHEKKNEIWIEYSKKDFF